MNIHLYKKNKRSQIVQVAFFIVILFVCSILILIMYKINTEFSKAVNESGLDYHPKTSNPSAVKDTLDNMMFGFLVFDYGFVIITIGLGILLIFTSFFIPTHPIYIVINFVGIFFLVFLGMIMSNVYGDIVSGEEQVLGQEAVSYPIQNWLMGYLPFIVAGIIFITTIIMYIRSNSTGLG